MFLKVYILVIIIILFLCHIARKKTEIRKYKELINKEDNIKFLETRTFEVIDKYEQKNIKKISPTKYIIKLKSTKWKEVYEETLEVSWGTYLKTKIGEKKNYNVYSQLGSNEIILIDEKNENKKGFFFDEVKILLISEYILIAAIALAIIFFGIIQFVN